MLKNHATGGVDEITLRSQELDQLAQAIRSIAERSKGDGAAILALLRVLEILHREIREGLFQESLPSNRRALYSLLKDIEASGGWPYIHRMRLQEFLKNLIVEDETCSETER
ncbi:MAG: hypothetical protein KME10_14585 [Plectolyngbya sp. WJT66-NPBG17]|nr:hypothetical protein [Plectolyngbya sp. WJT66-NPBG17]MBW4527640.1 hypothetical protein [Phormidium tanganyikae FI6-MK23]